VPVQVFHGLGDVDLPVLDVQRAVQERAHLLAAAFPRRLRPVRPVVDPPHGQQAAHGLAGRGVGDLDAQLGLVARVHAGVALAHGVERKAHPGACRTHRLGRRRRDGVHERIRGRVRGRLCRGLRGGRMVLVLSGERRGKGRRGKEGGGPQPRCPGR
jgi:hypothetical protein